ncbi:MAG: peptidoglycan DD-metalloendopeptidase family protein [Acidimicrobiia bacterium]
MRSPWSSLRARVAVPTLSVAVALVLGLSSLVATGAPNDDRARQLQDQIGEASAQEAAALAELDAIRVKKTAVDARVAELDQQLSAAEARLAPLVAEVERLAQSRAILQGEVDRTQAKLDGARDDFERSAAEQYRSARRGSAYDIAFAAPPEELVQQEKYLDRVSEERDNVVQRVTRLRQKLETQRRALEAQKAQADQAAADAQAVRDELTGLRTEIEPARAEAAAQEQAEADVVASIQAQKGDFEAELASLQAASDSIAARLRAIGAASGEAGDCQARPVPGEIGSPFGPRFHPVLHYTRMHTGADMRAGSGTPIHACRSGEVVIAGSQGGYGNAVVVNHGGGMATLYAHQSQIAASVGQQVAAGDVIGYVGSTGMSTGPHLHFEVRLSGNPVDPAPYLS